MALQFEPIFKESYDCDYLIFKDDKYVWHCTPSSYTIMMHDNYLLDFYNKNCSGYKTWVIDGRLWIKGSVPSYLLINNQIFYKHCDLIDFDDDYCAVKYFEIEDGKELEKAINEFRKQYIIK